ncbi:hypothetical protein T02_8541 [Trichinella nativa]|uniref:Uncharacterized protein n=1 Tax=Trichinella nativa TaxID=6335 RepID=A0A0V1KRV2_9BILA|nr:hypothetical protein T02_8541 [Trichinella nativa]
MNLLPVLLHFGTASWGCFYGWDNRTITCLQLLTASEGNGKSVENEENKMRKQKQSREKWFESVEQTSKHCVRLLITITRLKFQSTSKPKYNPFKPDTHYLSLVEEIYF